MTKFISGPIPLIGSCFLSLLFPSHAHANAGVPMIFLTLPGMLVGLVPIVVIEAYVIQSKLSFSWRQALKASTIANLVSTIIGTPITWALLLGVQILFGGSRAFGLATLDKKFLAVTLQAPWLIPYERDLHWMIPSAMLTLLVPYFLVSWWSEWKIMAWMNKASSEKSRIRNVIFSANLWSYGLLFLLVLGWLAFGLVTRDQ